MTAVAVKNMIRNGYIPLSDDFAGILGPRWGGIFDSGSTPRVGSLEGEIGDEKTASDRWPKTWKIIGKGYIYRIHWYIKKEFPYLLSLKKV